MAGGNVAYSDAKNSTIMRDVVDAGKELIKEAILENFDLKILGFDSPSTVVKILDLGCSVGPNTFFVMQNIVEAVELKFLQAKKQNLSALEFQAFFNDHKENDFNTLFKNLPPSRKFFAAGVPGSFHGRLFPKSSLHFAHMSYVLHFLSKVPKEVVDRNKSNILNFSEKEVVEAYSTQFKNDVDCFLNARAEELVSGGLMLILTTAVPDGISISDTMTGVYYDILGSCLKDLVKMGVLEEEKVNSFNMPAYAATVKELEAIFRSNRNFNIEKMEKFAPSIAPLTPESYELVVRAGKDELFRNHFGDEFAEQIFNHFTKKIQENFSKIPGVMCNNLSLFILLKRI